MTDRLRIALAQLNPTVGDVAGNLELIRAARAAAAAEGADLVVCGELGLCGYPPEDLVLKRRLQQSCRDAAEALARETADGGPGLLVGLPWAEGEAVYNTLALLDGGEMVGLRHKHELPNYGVFDEKRVFAAGPLPGPLPFRGLRLGAMICEDMWQGEVTECLAETGAEILVVANGSPFENDKPGRRLQLAVARVVESGLPLIYVNQVGGQDELVFDGGSFVLNGDRALAAQLPQFQEALAVTDWTREAAGWRCATAERAASPEPLEAIWLAMVTGLRDYVGKNRFPGVVLGMSGGIDSAITAAVATDALGPDRVWAAMLPYRYTSSESLQDAEDCSRRLGIRYDVVPIAPAVEAMNAMLAPLFAGREPDVTEENLQARMRGVALMALSNKFGHMVLTTGNKSENSVGYATLYGDMCGGYNVLQDVYKTTVFELARWRNRNHPPGVMGPGGEVIPERIISRPPSAELRPDQTDQDSLPPYDQLDRILESLVEHEMGVEEIAAQGFDPAMIRRVEGMLYGAEYKRRQAPPGVKITRRNFGRDRRYPMTNRFRDRS